jgi:hypothetical protein
MSCEVSKRMNTCENGSTPVGTFDPIIGTTYRLCVASGLLRVRAKRTIVNRMLVAAYPSARLDDGLLGSEVELTMRQNFFR